MDNLYNEEEGLLTEFFRKRLFLNMFVVCDEFNNLVLKPTIENEWDLYSQLSKMVLFADFYIYDEIRDMVLLKNDLLQITIILLYNLDKSNLEFIGVKTIADLIQKYPALLRSKIR